MTETRRMYLLRNLDVQYDSYLITQMKHWLNSHEIDHVCSPPTRIGRAKAFIDLLSRKLKFAESMHEFFRCLSNYSKFPCLKLFDFIFDDEMHIIVFEIVKDYREDVTFFVGVCYCNCCIMHL